MEAAENDGPVIAALEALWKAYENASDDFFAFFSADASVFSPSAPLRIEGRDAYRRHFGPFLGSQRRAAHFLHPRVLRLAAGGALVTCHVRIRVNYSSVDQRSRFRSTLVLVREGDGWKVAHLHISPLAAFAETPPGGGWRGARGARGGVAGSGMVEEITVLPDSPVAAPAAESE